jgi:hypothetical protein
VITLFPGAAAKPGFSQDAVFDPDLLAEGNFVPKDTCHGRIFSGRAGGVELGWQKSGIWPFEKINPISG